MLAGCGCWVQVGHGESRREKKSEALGEGQRIIKGPFVLAAEGWRPHKSLVVALQPRGTSGRGRDNRSATRGCRQSQAVAGSRSEKRRQDEAGRGRTRTGRKKGQKRTRNPEGREKWLRIYRRSCSIVGRLAERRVARAGLALECGVSVRCSMRQNAGQWQWQCNAQCDAAGGLEGSARGWLVGLVWAGFDGGALPGLLFGWTQEPKSLEN